MNIATKPKCNLRIYDVLIVLVVLALGAWYLYQYLELPRDREMPVVTADEEQSILMQLRADPKRVMEERLAEYAAKWPDQVPPHCDEAYIGEPLFYGARLLFPIVCDGRIRAALVYEKNQTGNVVLAEPMLERMLEQWRAENWKDRDIGIFYDTTGTHLVAPCEAGICYLDGPQTVVNGLDRDSRAIRWVHYDPAKRLPGTDAVAVNCPNGRLKT